MIASQSTEIDSEKENRIIMKKNFSWDITASAFELTTVPYKISVSSFKFSENTKYIELDLVINVMAYTPCWANNKNNLNIDL